MGKESTPPNNQRLPDSDASQIQKGLARIYRNRDGSLSDISHLDVRRTSRLRFISLVTAAIVVAAAFLAWAGFLIFSPNSKLNQESLALTFDGPRTIASGDEVTYILQYRNIEKVPVNDVEIIFRWPDGFEFLSSEPATSDEARTIWSVGSLDRNQQGTITVKGRLIGEVGTLKTINATASYRPQNFSATFKQTASMTSQVTSSILELTIEGPEKILPEKKAEYKIKYRNTSDQDQSQIKIIVTYPVNFVFQSAEPEPFSREEDARQLNNQWVIDRLEKNQEGEIVISGGFAPDEENSQAELTAAIGFFDEAEQTFAIQQKQTIITEILNPGLKLDLIVNGSTQDQAVNFGDTLTYSLVYKNVGGHDLDDVAFQVTIDSAVTDWERLEDKHAGIIKDNTITWTKDQISQFDVIRPGDEGSIDFSLPIKESDQINRQNTNLQTTSRATATLVAIDELPVVDLLIESNEIKNNVNTDITLTVEGRYFDDDNIAVGTGPLPPVVGQTTTFRIYWSIANRLNTVEDIRVTTVLPDGVEWAEKFLVSAGEISFSKQSRIVTWAIDRLTTSQSAEQTAVWFDVAVTPTKDQVRKLIILTDQTVLLATDSTTDGQVSRTGTSITSNLDDDPVGGGRGLVIDITE